MTKGSKTDERKQENSNQKENEKLSFAEKKEIKEKFIEHLAEMINIDREIMYIRYAKMLFDKTSQIFNVNIVPSVSLETNRAEAPEAMMRILSENRIMDNIVYEIFSSVLIPPEEFYLRNLEYIDDNDGVSNYKTVMIKSSEDLMDYDYADYVTKHNKDAVRHIKELDKVHRFQEAQKHPKQANQNNPNGSKDTLQSMIDNGVVERIKEQLDKIKKADDSLKHTNNPDSSQLNNEKLSDFLKDFDLAGNKKKHPM